jgi:metallo-beta-lactamase family protein
MPDPTPPPAADLVVIESTYGDRLHDNERDLASQLAATITATTARGGTLVIPCFAVERAQELLFHLQRLRKSDRIPKLPIFLDSPMAVNLLRVFGRHPEALDAQSRGRLAVGDSPFHLPELRLCSSREESKHINEVEQPSVIIAGSGMITGGRIKHHLSRFIEDNRSTLLFVGYQASGTLGRQLLEGATEIRLFGQWRNVGIRVQQIHGFSGHADQQQLLAWLALMPGGLRRVAVVHGGASVSTSFAQLVHERFGCQVTVPEYGESIQL